MSEQVADKPKGKTWFQAKIEDQEAEIAALKATLKTVESGTFQDRMQSALNPETASVVPAVGPDSTQNIYAATAMDPFHGAIIEVGWRYIRVVEHPPALGLPSAKLEAFRLGYKVAPAPADVLESWDEAKAWTMRCPQALWDARKAANDARARDQRGASKSPDNPNQVVVTDVHKRTSRADLGLAEAMNG